VKQVGFKPGVKERGSYGCAEGWIRRGRSDGWRNRWVGNGELVPDDRDFVISNPTPSYYSDFIKSFLAVVSTIDET